MPIYEVEQGGRTFEVDAPNLHAAITALNIRAASSAKGPKIGADQNQVGMEYGLAGALPPDTPGPLAAASAGMMAVPAAVAVGPGPLLAGARAAAPYVIPAAKEVVKRASQGAGAAAAWKLYDALMEKK